MSKLSPKRLMAIAAAAVPVLIGLVKRRRR